MQVWQPAATSEESKIGLAGLESWPENDVFSAVKDKEGRPVVPAVVPIQPIPAELVKQIRRSIGASILLDRLDDIEGNS